VQWSQLVNTARELQLFLGFLHATGGRGSLMSTMDMPCDFPKKFWYAKLFVVGFKNVTDENIADRKHVTLQDLVSLPTFKNRARLSNLSAKNESGQNRAEIV
jgi:hypothetical protein